MGRGRRREGGRLLGLCLAGLLMGSQAAWAGAEAVPASLRGALAPADLPARWAAREGAEAPELACEPLVEEVVSLCFQVEGSRGGLRWVTGADLAGWSVSVAELRAELARRLGPAAARVGERREVEGGGGSWWLAAPGTGQEVAALLHPQALAAHLEASRLRLAVPNMGLVVAWEGDGGELDMIMSVAVWEMVERQERPVSPVVLQWRSGRWEPWAEARPPSKALGSRPSGAPVAPEGAPREQAASDGSPAGGASP